ncbi:hypothetical protein [Bacillus solitudinis]|nr:hypothetical protein [Bacillus solitudinis]
MMKQRLKEGYGIIVIGINNENSINEFENRKRAGRWMMKRS